LRKRIITGAVGLTRANGVDECGGVVVKRNRMHKAVSPQSMSLRRTIRETRKKITQSTRSVCVAKEQAI